MTMVVMLIKTVNYFICHMTMVVAMVTKNISLVCHITMVNNPIYFGLLYKLMCNTEKQVS